MTSKRKILLWKKIKFLTARSRWLKRLKKTFSIIILPIHSLSYRTDKIQNQKLKKKTKLKHYRSLQIRIWKWALVFMHISRMWNLEKLQRSRGKSRNLKRKWKDWSQTYLNCQISKHPFLSMITLQNLKNWNNKS